MARTPRSFPGVAPLVGAIALAIVSFLWSWYTGSAIRLGAHLRPRASIERQGNVIHRPTDVGAFEFVVLAGLRAAQLTRGCTPRVEGLHKTIMLAQMEVAAGKVARAPTVSIVAVE